MHGVEDGADGSVSTQEPLMPPVSAASLVVESNSFASSKNSGSRSTASSGRSGRRSKYRRELATFKPSVHPVEPPNLRRKILVGRDRSPSWRTQILYGDNPKSPGPGTSHSQGSSATSSASVTISADAASTTIGSPLSRSQSQCLGRPLATIDSEPGPVAAHVASRTASGTDFKTASRAASRIASKRASRTVSGTDFRSSPRTASRAVSKKASSSYEEFHCPSIPNVPPPDKTPTVPDDEAVENPLEFWQLELQDGFVFGAPRQEHQTVPSEIEEISTPQEQFTPESLNDVPDALAVESTEELLSNLPVPPQELPEDVTDYEVPQGSPTNERADEIGDEAPREISPQSVTSKERPEELLESPVLLASGAVEHPGDDEESTALVVHSESAPGGRQQEPVGGALGGTVRDIADYRAAAKLKYEQAKKGQSAVGVGPTDLKSLRDLLRQSFLDVQGGKDVAGAPASWAPRDVRSLQDAPGVHKSEDIDVSCGSSTAASSRSLESPDADALQSSQDTDSTCPDSSSNSSGRQREDTFESDEGLLITIRNEHDEEAANEVEHKRCLLEPAEEAEPAPAGSRPQRSSAAVSSAMVAAFVQVAAAMSGAMGAAMAATLEEAVSEDAPCQAACCRADSVEAALAALEQASPPHFSPTRRAALGPYRSQSWIEGDSDEVHCAEAVPWTGPRPAAASRIVPQRSSRSAPHHSVRMCVSVGTAEHNQSRPGSPAAAPRRRASADQPPAPRSTAVGKPPGTPGAVVLLLEGESYNRCVLLQPPDDTVSASSDPADAEPSLQDADYEDRPPEITEDDALNDSGIEDPVPEDPDDVEGAAILQTFEDEGAVEEDGGLSERGAVGSPVSKPAPPAVDDSTSAQSPDGGVLSPVRSPARSPSRSPNRSHHSHRSAISARSIRTNMEIHANKAQPLQRSIVCGISTRGRTIPVYPMGHSAEEGAAPAVPRAPSPQRETQPPPPESACAPNTVVFPTSMVDSRALIAGLEAAGEPLVLGAPPAPYPSPTRALVVGRTGPLPVRSRTTVSPPPPQPPQSQPVPQPYQPPPRPPPPPPEPEPEPEEPEPEPEVEPEPEPEPTSINSSKSSGRPPWNASTKASPDLLSQRTYARDYARQTREQQSGRSTPRSAGRSPEGRSPSPGGSTGAGSRLGASRSPSPGAAGSGSAGSRLGTRSRSGDLQVSFRGDDASVRIPAERDGSGLSPRRSGSALNMTTSSSSMGLGRYRGTSPGKSRVTAASGAQGSRQDGSDGPALGAERRPRKLRRPMPTEERVPKYQSKFHYLVRHEFYKAKKDHGTMGYAEVPVDPPNNFLKKNAYFKLRPKIDTHPDYPTVLGRPEARPKAPARTVYDEARGRKAPLGEPKDYTKINIQNAVRAVPRQPPARAVDTRRGSTLLMETSGLEPKYIFRKDYGKVPEYLCRRLQQEEEARQEAERRRESVKPLLRHISEEERLSLIGGLKQNWQELQTIFQGLPMLTDTIPKMKRKESLEQELRQLERDIAIVERNPVIFVDEGAGDACVESSKEH
ncbi:serine/arginine repetitive matrix protein 2 isoform X2 [Frankliniella occidentalis]|uniref:Serine/arginine repetitive matrix protein 2 isoform X2 n=1 Tax=Frankliniella occidentalis TaxID=133901 RepID=A0A9C6U2D2_FRAOC|nr:serine/arginine repetitive matrix protein 2 isoform X2 [Frankliniella occidentalis]